MPPLIAGVVELVDAPDSKSGSERSVGSSPTTRTNPERVFSPPFVAGEVPQSPHALLIDSFRPARSGSGAWPWVDFIRPRTVFQPDNDESDYDVGQACENMQHRRQIAVIYREMVEYQTIVHRVEEDCHQGNCS